MKWNLSKAMVQITSRVGITLSQLIVRFFEDIHVITLQTISSIGDLHKELSLELKFPNLYGMNWDAFWDCMTGLVEMPGILKLTGRKEFSVRFPYDSELLKKNRRCFQQAIS